MLRWIVALFLLSFVFQITATGQIVRLSSYESLSKDAVRPIIPGPAGRGPVDMVDASNLYTAWGVRFRGSGPTAPRFQSNCLPVPITPLCSPGIINAAPTGQSSANWPLIVDFDLPVSRVVFLLSTTTTAQVTAHVQAYNSAGTLLGTVEQEGIGSWDTYPWPVIGLETNTPEGISRLVIDYGSSEHAELISSLTFDYVKRPTFRTLMPQIAYGQLPGTDLSLETGITVLNLAGTTAQAAVRFYDSGGQPLSLVFGDGQARDAVNMELVPFGSQTVTAERMIEPAIAGYAVVESDFPLAATGLFRVVGRDGQIVSEAGIDAATDQTYCQTSVTKSATGLLDVGFAIVNVSDQPAQVNLKTFGRDFETNQHHSTISLLPGEHVAEFLGELFDDIADSDFDGGVLIRSDQPIAITVLRTSGGIVLSSLPVVSGEKWPSIR